jgi:hypothetical protein
MDEGSITPAAGAMRLRSQAFLINLVLSVAKVGFVFHHHSKNMTLSIVT